MRKRTTGAPRLISFTTASLLAAALLSPAHHAQETEPAELTEAIEATEERIVVVDEDSAAEETQVPAEELPEDDIVEQIRRANPDIDPAILQQLRRQFDELDQLDIEEGIEFEVPPPPHGEPASDRPVAPMPEPLDAAALIEIEKQRAKAEALIAQLADAEEADLPRIEQELAKLGQASLVPLKLAALSDDFTVRTRAGAMARRLRWRLVASETLLALHADLPKVLAAEAQKPRREMIENLIAQPQTDYVPIFVECLADRDPYIRERGIDGLVLIGKTFDKAAAGRALQAAALNSDDKSVVLLSVTGLGEIEQVDIQALTELFEKTEHAEVQRTILMAAGYSGNAQAIGLIERAIKDPRWRVRAAGLEALEDISRNADKARLGRIIGPLLTDPEPFIRANALRLVAELKLPGGTDTVWKMIEDGSIEESVGLETLAALQDSKAYIKIKELYDAATQAKQHDEAIRWMTHLGEYQNRSSVDALLKNVIKDSTLREQWPSAIYLASRRSDEDAFVPIVAPLLIDEDADIRTAAWSSFGRYSMSEYKLPAKIDQGLATGDTEQRVWRLKLIYQQSTKGIGALTDVLEDDNPIVVNLALAMIADTLVEDSLGEDDLPYRSSSRDFSIDRLGNYVPNEPVKPELDDAAAAKIRKALDHTDPLARVRAAALLYALDGDRSDKAKQLLKDAIRSNAPGRVAAGLFAALTEHADLIEGVDLLDLSKQHQDPYLLKNLCGVMLKVGDQKLVDRAIVISEDFEIYSDEAYFITLAATGAQPAIDLVQSKLLDGGGYYARQFIQTMTTKNPDVAIQIGAVLLESPKMDSYDRRDILSNLIRTEKNDQLIPLLKQQIKRTLASNDDFERHQVQQYQQLLLQIDPESAQEQIITALKSGKPSEQQQAVQTLIQISEPSDKIVDMVLKTVLARKAEVDPSWALIVGWMQPTKQYEMLEEAISELPGPMQSAMLAEMAERVEPKDLDLLLSIKPATTAARDRVTMIVAELTTKHPEARPKSLDGVSATAKVYLLAAAGQWEGGEALLRRSLEDADRAVADAALRGLAIARLLDEKQTLTPADTDRFADAVLSKDSFTAYLAAEVLYQSDQARLLAVPTDQVSSRLALLRIGCAGEVFEKGPVEQAIRTVLENSSSASSTEVRLALIAAIKIKDESSFLAAWRSGNHTYSQGDLLGPALRVFDTPDLLHQAVFQGIASADDPNIVARVEQAVAQAQGRSNMYLGMYLSRGLIKKASLDQTELFLESLSLWSARGDQGNGANALLKMLGEDAPALKTELKRIMLGESPIALDAALLVYQIDRDQEALKEIRKSVFKINPRQAERMRLTDQQIHAIAIVGRTGDQADAQALIDLYQQLPNLDSWQARSLAQQLMAAAMMIDPYLLIENYKTRRTKGEEAVAAYSLGDSFTFADLLNASIVDDADADADKQMIEPAAMHFSRQLLTIKQSNQTGGLIASPPWDYYANQDGWQGASREELATLERDLVMNWISTGEYDIDQAELLDRASYYFQDDSFVITPPAHEQRLIMLSDYYNESSGVTFNDPQQVNPANYYAALDSIFTLVPLSEVQDEAIKQLIPLLESEDAQVAARAARVAATWRATELRESLLKAVARPDTAGLEAAWASARLFGPDALDAVLARAKATNHYDERVELACLLTLLGETEWSAPIIDRAHRLLAVQQLRGRVLKPVQQFDRDGSADNIGFHDAWGGNQRGSESGIESIIDGRLPGSNARWATLLTTTAPQAKDDALSRRLDLSPALDRQIQRDPAQTDKIVGQPLKLVFNGIEGLAFAEGTTNNLPIPELVGSYAPQLMHLEKHEANLFAGSLTQLAKQGLNGSGLESAWQDWLAEHAADDPDALWRAGVSNAAESLTDAKWWRRALAHERLQRLTGQAIEQPVLFDLDQWSSLQSKWQAWAASEPGASPRAALSAVALESGLIQAAPDNAEEELAMLVQMAGWGDDVQSIAALHRLELWQDTKALISASAAWQIAPRAQLRAWYLNRATDQPRIFVPAEAIR